MLPDPRVRSPLRAVEPYADGLLDVGHGNRIYWEACGYPAGPPAVVLHGGPGMGCTLNMRRAVDPARFRVVLFDQRGCGRSTPNAADPSTGMADNTTHHLVADIEALRERLGIDRWLVFGGSWGSTLALAYAETHPERVSGMVLVAITTSRRSEIDWLYRGVARFFPEAWERFRLAAPSGTPDDWLPAAYADLMEHPDPDVRAAAADAWCAWEDAVVSLDPGRRKFIYSDRPTAARQAFVRICARYFAHGAWLEEGALIRDAGRLAGIPGALVHGRLDMSCPPRTAWELSRAWPGVHLLVVDNVGHQGEAMREAIGAAMDRVAAAAGGS